VIEDIVVRPYCAVCLRDWAECNAAQCMTNRVGTHMETQMRDHLLFLRSIAPPASFVSPRR